MAYTPVPSNHQAFGRGAVACDPGAPSWQYTIRMANDAGSVLAERMGGPLTGNQVVVTPTRVCTGAYVHSFLYINVGGAGKSDTSGHILC
jgi:hypothetical protein